MIFYLFCTNFQINSYAGLLNMFFFIPDPGSEFFPSRIRIKDLSILTQKIVSELSEIWSRLIIPDPDPVFFTRPGSLIQGSKRHRIPYPGPQHWQQHFFLHPWSQIRFLSSPDPHQIILSILTQKIGSKLSEILSGLFIPVPDFFYLCRIQGSKRHRIPDPDLIITINSVGSLPHHRTLTTVGSPLSSCMNFRRTLFRQVAKFFNLSLVILC
jgi:hypothetical protein